MHGRDRLLIGLPKDRPALRSGTGAGRVWDNVEPRLGAQADVRELSPGRRRWRPRVAPDAWLLPGAPGVVDVREPVVVVNHGAPWLSEETFWEHSPRAYAELFIAAAERTLEAASMVIVPSEYTRRGVVSGLRLSPDQVVAVHHGVDCSVFAPDAGGGRERVHAALGEPRPYVLFASIPSIPQKNLPALREAMTILAGRGFPHALVIAGGLAGGESADEIARISEPLPSHPGRIGWLGHQDDRDLAGLMAGASAFCLPSLFESFGLTALEALACGAPSVVADRGALPEVVGDAAVKVAPRAQELADALERVLVDEALAVRLRAAGRLRALEFSWDRTAQGWIDAVTAAAA